MIKFKVVKGLIKRAGFPTTNKNYKEAHSEADAAEKRKYPKQYKDMKKVDKKIPYNKLVGKNFKSGKVEVSSKVPNKDRKDVALHEKTENKAIKRMSKK